MKVGIVCPYDWSHPGGVRTHIEGLAAALKRRGVEVEILAPASGREPGVFRLGGAVGIPANGSIARLCFSPSAARKLKERTEQGDLDLLHLHEPGVPSTSLLALMTTDLPTVATFHASRPRSAGYFLARPILGRYLQRLDERIAVSVSAEQLIGRYFPGEYRLIPNGVDYRRFSSAEPDPELAQLGPFVLFVGRPEPRKGFAVILEAMEIVRHTNPVPLVAVGPEPRDVPEWVVALGADVEKRKPSIYAAAHVYCAPSTGGESFGIVLAEAMAAGAPVVCSDIPGYREAAAGAALMVPPRDPAALAGRLLQVLHDEDLRRRMVEKGTLRARELDWEVLVEEVLAAYRSAYDGGR